MDAEELSGYREAAENEGLRLSEWVRLRLREAKRGGPARNTEKKLRAIRVATSYSFPASGISQMLTEIEAGRTTE